MKKLKLSTLLLLTAAMLGASFTSCRSDDDTPPPGGGETVTEGEDTSIKGFFLLNQGNMGTNTTTIDYFDYESGNYYRNIFSTLNPTIVRGLGDVGQDIAVYGNKLYAVINGSNLLEVMDARTGRHINTVTINNPRYITFHANHAYVSSYNGLRGEDVPQGVVVKIDTATLNVVSTCTVGYQPEDMTIRDNKLYVANSGGYRAPDYDNTVSVIDLATFTEQQRIVVGINGHLMTQDSRGMIYVITQANYPPTVPSNISMVDLNDQFVGTLDVRATGMALYGDSLLVHAQEYFPPSFQFSVFNTKTLSKISDSYITDGTDQNFVTPFCIATNVENGEIFMTDATNYVSSGVLYCFNANGTLKWSTRTGDIPAAIAFTRHRLETLEELTPSANRK